MTARDYVIVIGDSQTRSLAYHRNLLAFRIGSATFNHFLTPQRVKKTRSKALTVIQKFDPNNHILMFYHGDTIHHVEDTFDTWSDDPAKWEGLITQAAKDYVETCRQAQELISGRIIVSLALPNRERTRITAEVYNRVLREECEKFGLLVFDPWPGIAPDGFLLDRYRADFAHVNHNVTPYLISYLQAQGLLTPTAQGESDFGLRYAYSFAADEDPIAAWGNYPKDKLILEEGNVLPAKEYHPDTQLALQCLNEIDLFSASIEALIHQKPSLTVLDCCEGLLPISVTQSNYDEILGIDTNADRLKIARELAHYSGSKASFLHLSDLKQIADLNATHIVVNLDRREGRESLRFELFKQTQKQCLAFFFLSLDSPRDRKMLKQAGYKWCGRFPIRNRFETDYNQVALLAAFNFEPSAEWVTALEDSLIQWCGLIIEHEKHKAAQMLTSEIERLKPAPESKSV